MSATAVQPTYALNAERTAITCLLCRKTSYNPYDVLYLYCGHCHTFHEGGK